MGKTTKIVSHKQVSKPGSTIFSSKLSILGLRSITLFFKAGSYSGAQCD